MGPVLLVIDMQEHFREMAEGCLPPLNALIDTCHSLGIPVIYTQHGHLDPEAEEASSVLVRWWGAGGSIRCALAPAAARREQAQQIPAYRCAALCAQPLSPPPPPPGMALRPGSCCPSCGGTQGRMQ